MHREPCERERERERERQRERERDFLETMSMTGASRAQPGMPTHAHRDMYLEIYRDIQRHIETYCQRHTLNVLLRHQTCELEASERNREGRGGRGA